MYSIQPGNHFVLEFHLGYWSVSCYSWDRSHIHGKCDLGRLGSACWECGTRCWCDHWLATTTVILVVHCDNLSHGPCMQHFVINNTDCFGLMCLSQRQSLWDHWMRFVQVWMAFSMCHCMFEQHILAQKYCFWSSRQCNVLDSFMNMASSGINSLWYTIC